MTGVALFTILVLTPPATAAPIRVDQSGGVYSSGNLVTDPLFCDLAGGDYTLCDNSPCLLMNDPVGTSMGAYPDVAGCGACASSTVRDISWGAIKALYR